MSNIPAAPLEGTSSSSADEKAIMFLTEDDNVGGLQASLFTVSPNGDPSATTNGQRLRALAVGGRVPADISASDAPVVIGAKYEVTDVEVDDGDVTYIKADEKGRLRIVLEDSVPISVGEYNITLTSQDTEYSETIPADVKSVRFRCRTAAAIRFAWQTGRVAGEISPYQTLASGDEYFMDRIKLSANTPIYFAGDSDGLVVELETWT